MRTVNFYAVLKPSKYYYKSPALARTTKKTPALKPKEIAIRIQLELPDDWDQPTTIPLNISHNQIQRPTAKVQSA